jgi:hypothetical protein
MSDDDARDLKLHKAIDHAIVTFGMMFGLSRDEVIDRFEAFLEAEREEREAKARSSALEEVRA